MENLNERSNRSIGDDKENMSNLCESKDDLDYMKCYRKLASWLSKNMVSRGELECRKWKSGDATTTLRTNNGATNLNEFHPKKYDWYVTETRDEKFHELRVKDGVEKLLNMFGVEVEYTDR